MLSNLFVNATILISFIFLAGQCIKETPNLSKTLRGKILVGVFGGLLGILLTLYSINVHGETRIDFRFIPIILLVFYTNPISTLIGAVIIAVFRIVYYSLSLSSILGAVAILAIVLGCFYLSTLRVKEELKYYIMFFYSLLIILGVYIILLKDSTGLGSMILVYSIIYSITGIVVRRLTEYVLNSNKLYIQYKEQCSKDFLTGLNNVRQFDSALNEAYKRVVDFDEKLSILAIDIDHFKKVNDTYGHDGGDAVLKQLGEALISSSRSFDIVARIGGEEFSVLLLDCPSSQAMEVAERLRKYIGNKKFILPDGKEINISVSIGVATYPDTTDDLDQLKKQADIELYKAKETGRNKVCSVLSKDC